MNRTLIHSQLIERFEATMTPWGRWRAINSFYIKRWLERLWSAQGPFVKRALDVSVSAVFLLCLAPLFLLVAILIKLEDGGPIFFAQIRVGKFGRTFRMYKFRSMCLDAEQRLKDLLAKNERSEGVTFKIKDDPRITKIGKWLRKFSIDELPQFYNVWIGDMSLVGPRPPVPREVALYSLADRRRLSVTPGLTCFWQIGDRNQIDFSQQVELDVQYIEKQSPWLDLQIIAKTIPAVLAGRGA
jgi:lipopolysaccharide/colanic/teichoic acid biosynthesis glycosyltransferase